MRPATIIICIELSANFADSAKKFSNIDLLVADFVNFSSTTKIDLVIMLGTVSDFTNLSPYLRRVKELLKAGGQ